VAISQVVSIAGAAMVLGAFALLQFHKLQPLDRSYLLLNVAGSACLAVAAWLAGLWAFVVLNSVWGLVSVRSLARVLRGVEGPRTAGRLAGRGVDPDPHDHVPG
jgi:hypothetical protein